MTEQYKLGSKKDPVDERDYKIKNYLKATVSILPTKLDLRDRFLTVRDQGNEGSCVSFGATAMKEGQEAEKVWLSPRFLTQRIQADADSGAFPRDAMDVLLKEGVCTEECQPYIAREVNTPPCSEAPTMAKANKIGAYARIYTIDEMKQTINEKGFFIASFGVTKDWYTPVNGLVTPHSQNPIIGGHLVCIAGYDDEKELLLFRNSWNTTWGDHGYGYLTYADVKSYLWDAWSSVDIPEEEEDRPRPLPMPIPPDPIPVPPPTQMGVWRTLINLLMRLLGWKK